MTGARIPVRDSGTREHAAEEQLMERLTSALRSGSHAVLVFRFAANPRILNTTGFFRPVASAIAGVVSGGNNQFWVSWPAPAAARPLPETWADCNGSGSNYALPHYRASSTAGSWSHSWRDEFFDLDAMNAAPGEARFYGRNRLCVTKPGQPWCKYAEDDVLRTAGQRFDKNIPKLTNQYRHMEANDVYVPPATRLQRVTSAPTDPLRHQGLQLHACRARASAAGTLHAVSSTNGPTRSSVGSGPRMATAAVACCSMLHRLS
eukprot:2872699-Prymnesium_polylepis.2